MAIYHFNLTTVQRSKGQSIVKVIASTFGETLHDSKTNQTYNYLNKRNGLIHKEIMLPSQAQDWMGDRSKLWDYTERNEKRKDAILAKKFGLALPNEFKEEVNVELAKEFVGKYFISQGMIADLCIYYTKDSTDPYLIVFTTLREIQDGGFGKKVREWYKRQALLLWREQWANMLNIYLAKHGYSNQKVTHQSLKAQGIPLIPLGKVGAKEAWIRLTDLADKQTIGIMVNEEMILECPEVILYAISKQYEDFTEEEIDAFIKKNTCSDESFYKIKDMVMQSPYLLLSDKSKKRFKVVQELN